MLGGWCEATPLQLQAAIRERRGESSLSLRVGSIAIPIAHYRNTFKKRLEPEQCHEDSLRGACQVLGEAVRLCHRWPFGLRDPKASGAGPETAELVDTLLKWQDRFTSLSSVNMSWIREMSDRRAVV